MVTLGGTFRIDSQADTDSSCSAFFYVLTQLALRIKDDMVRNLQNLLQIRILEGWSKDMDFAPKFLTTQFGFVKARCGCASQILADEGIGSVHGIGFLGQENLAACAVLDRLENF